MKRLPYATATISGIVAIVLFSIASWFEDDERWTELAVTETPDMSMSQARDDTAVRVNTGVASCAQAEDDLRRKVESAQYCATDDDCTLFDYGYPIQCMTSVAKVEITPLRLEYRKYEASCAYRVYYDCPSGNAERQAVCRNNHCEVELLTIDLLKDQTLDYLGIE